MKKHFDTDGLEGECEALYAQKLKHATLKQIKEELVRARMDALISRSLAERLLRHLTEKGQIPEDLYGVCMAYTLTALEKQLRSGEGAL